MEYTYAEWILFNAAVAVLLLLDLLVFNRKAHEIKTKEALGWSAFWIALALAFNYWIYLTHGAEAGTTFLTAYLVEKSLSVDNLFVFLLIFAYFKTPVAYEHKVLFWGVLGAIFFRILFIFGGIALLQHLSWMVYVFGAILIWAGFRILYSKDEDIHPEKNPVIHFFRKFVRVTPDYVEDRFFVNRAVTPLFLVLIMIETTDIVFAIDSIPAVLAITRDPFIVYTSNISAILGLRALFFALSRVMKLFHYLHYGLSLILVFIGCKLLLEGVYKVPTLYTLSFIGVVLSISVIASLLYPEKTKHL